MRILLLLVGIVAGYYFAVHKGAPASGRHEMSQQMPQKIEADIKASLQRFNQEGARKIDPDLHSETSEIEFDRVNDSE